MYIKKKRVVNIVQYRIEFWSAKKKYSIELEDEERYHNQNADITS